MLLKMRFRKEQPEAVVPREQALVLAHGKPVVLQVSKAVPGEQALVLAHGDCGA